MREDNGCRVQEEGRLDHLPWVHRTAVNGPPEQPAELNDSMPVIQEQAAEDLMLIPC